MPEQTKKEKDIETTRRRKRIENIMFGDIRTIEGDTITVGLGPKDDPHKAGRYLRIVVDMILEKGYCVVQGFGKSAGMIPGVTFVVMKRMHQLKMPVKCLYFGKEPVYDLVETVNVDTEEVLNDFCVVGLAVKLSLVKKLK